MDLEHHSSSSSSRKSATYLADMGVLSTDELLLALFLLLPFAIGVDAFRGDDDPKPTGVCRSEDSRPPPERMLEDLRGRRWRFCNIPGQER